MGVKMGETISVIGAGAWGTAQAILYAEKGHKVRLWIYEKDVLEQIKQGRENKHFLPGFQLPESIEITSDLGQAVNSSKIIFFVVPSPFFRKVVSKLPKDIGKDVILVSAAKGIEEGSLKRMSEVLEEEFPNNKNIAVLSGPNLSKEIAAGKPATTVVASKNDKIAKYLQRIIMQERFRVYTSRDVTGVELGGALKNPIAVAAGIADGLELGNNTKSALLVRGITEITRLGVALGADPLTFAGLSGMGDMIATCSSLLSRNHHVGEELAKGRRLKDILAPMKTVAEGVLTSKAAYALGKKYKVELPIISELHKVMFEGKGAYEALSDLLIRPGKAEQDSAL
jgi:glycerol-3-phosphate dehydrogenase (NAD(P)+)